jgi:hypothetical protein
MFPKWMPNPFASFLPGNERGARFDYTPDPDRVRAMQERQRASDYLVRLSRSSQRGQDYARNTNDLRQMLQTAQDTRDPLERHAIINAMRNKGLLSE